MAVGRSIFGHQSLPLAASSLPALCLFWFPHLTGAAATPTSSEQNVTIQAPSGSRYLPAEHLICTPSTWKSIVIFFLANYFAHAGTVKALPGQTAMTAFVSAFLALLLPTSGTITGIETMFQHAILSSQPLERASRSGALCVVIRTPSWKPANGDVVRGIRRSSRADPTPRQDGQKKTRPVMTGQARKDAVEEKKEDPIRKVKDQTGDTQKSTVSQTQALEEGSLTVGVETLPPARLTAFWPTWSEWSLINRKVHGICCLPAGYALAMLPKGVKVDPVLEPRNNHNRNIDKGKRYGWKSWWREHIFPLDPYRNLPFYSREAETDPDASSSDELSASYNFYKTSIALFQTIYASLTLFQTRGDQINRFGYAAFGLTVVPYLIMSLVNLLGNILTPDYPSVYLVGSDVMVEAARRTQGRFEGMVGQFTERHDPDTIDASFQVDDSGKTSLTVLSSHPPSSVPSWQNVSSHQVKGYNASPPDFIVPGTPAVGDFSQRWSQRWRIFGCCLLVVSLVVGVVGGLSRFRKGSSTLAQRIWTMVWLCLAIGIGTLPYLYVTMQDLEDDAARANVFLLLVLLVYSVPGIGGFVVVGQMIQAYGTCSQIY